MDNNQYNEWWNKIQNQKATLRTSNFWKLVEEVTNKQIKAFFLSSDPNFPYHLGFDDDKIHYHYSASSDMQGLSPQHHTKDNRRGLTLHTCVYSATCVPISVHFQRWGESVQDTYA